MKIKLALLDNDQVYLNRITATLEGRYADKLEIYCFTDLEKTINTLRPAGINVLLASKNYDINLKELPQQCGFAYLTENQNIDSFNGEGVVCKFQKIDLFQNKWERLIGQS